MPRGLLEARPGRRAVVKVETSELSFSADQRLLAGFLIVLLYGLDLLPVP